MIVINSYVSTYVTLLVLLCLSYSSFSQVGIKTTNPRTTLEVAGDMKISNTIDIGIIDQLEDADTPTFLNQGSANTIKALDVSNPTGVALGYIQEYVLTNLDGDWVLDFDTGISSTDFVVTIISAYFDQELIITFGSTSSNFSLPYTSIYSSGGTWHIIADFPGATPRYTSPSGVWTINTLILSQDLSKQFGAVEINMSSNSTGSAVSPIID